jgi:hypothetical protein
LWTELKIFTPGADAESQIGIGPFHACKFGMKFRLDQCENT